MKSSFITVRRASVSLATMALSVGGLAIGAPPASAAPADPDITGVVVDTAGAGLVGIDVSAFTTPSDGSPPRFVSGATTDATGRYSLDDLDPVSLASGTSSPAIASEIEFKLYFSWSPSAPADFHATGYVSRGLGGTNTLRAAGSVVVPAVATATAPTQALPTAGGVLLKVLGPTGGPVTSFGEGILVEPDSLDPFNAFVTAASTGGDDDFYPDGPDPDTQPDAPDDGLIYISGVEPAQSYAVQASGLDFDEATDTIKPYISRFFGGNGTYSAATPVQVNAGAFTPVTVQLTDQLTPLQAPRIIGDSSFGSTLEAEPGTWLGPPTSVLSSVRQSGVDYTYQWLRGTTPVGTGSTYTLTKQDKKAQIRLVVTAFRADFVGTAVSAPTSKVGEKSTVKVRKIAGGKLAVTVKVTKKKLAKKLGVPKGKVVLITEDGTFASKKARLRAGQATLAPKAKFAGVKLSVLYLGGGKLGSDTAAVKGGKKG